MFSTRKKIITFLTISLCISSLSFCSCKKQSEMGDESTSINPVSSVETDADIDTEKEPTDTAAESVENTDDASYIIVSEPSTDNETNATENINSSESSVSITDTATEIEYESYITDSGLLLLASNNSETSWFDVSFTAELLDEKNEVIDTRYNVASIILPGQTVPITFDVGNIECESFSVQVFAETTQSSITDMSGFVNISSEINTDGTLDVTIDNQSDDLIEMCYVTAIYLQDQIPVGFDVQSSYIIENDILQLYFDGVIDKDGKYIDYNDVDIYVTAYNI